MRPNYLLSVFVFCTIAGCGTHPSNTPEPVGEEVSIAANLPFNPFQWKVISSSINPQAGTMATLYGNDLAVRSARNGTQPAYPPGAVLSLVTWYQRPDSHWFGAKIPGRIKSVEFVAMEPASDEGPLRSYQEFTGSPLIMTRLAPAAALPDPRIDYILGQRASVMP
jgi:hypothetical protein